MLSGTPGSNRFQQTCSFVCHSFHLRTAWTPAHVGVLLFVRNEEQICGNRRRSPGMISGPTGFLV